MQKTEGAGGQIREKSIASKFCEVVLFLSFNGADVRLLMVAVKVKMNERNPNNVNQV